MRVKTFNAAGAIVFWTLSSRIDRVKLEQGLAHLGHAELLPNERTHYAALKSAMTKLFVDGDVLRVIRPLKDNDGFVVMSERRGAIDNDLSSVVSVRFNKHGSLLVKELQDPQNRLVAEAELCPNRIRAAFKIEQGILTNQPVSGMLRNLVHKLHGTMPKREGFVYYLPNDSIDKFREVSDLVEACSIGSASETMILQVTPDENTLKAIKVTIEREISAEATAMAEYLDDKAAAGIKVGDKVLERRKRKLERLSDKLKVYEAQIGENLQSSRDLLKSVQRHQVLASLMTGAAPLFPSTPAAEPEIEESSPVYLPAESSQEHGNPLDVLATC